MEQPLSEEQCQQFEELGFTMVDGPWMDGSAEGQAFLDRCEATFDRLTAPEAERKADKEDDEGALEGHAASAQLGVTLSPAPGLRSFAAVGEFCELNPCGG